MVEVGVGAVLRGHVETAQLLQVILISIGGVALAAATTQATAQDAQAEGE